MLLEDKRRRSEEALGQALGEHEQMLLPLALALARLAARRAAAADSGLGAL